MLTSNGEQLANLSFAGQIALYGDRGVVIEWTNGTISEAVFTLPIATIVNQNQTSQQLEIICANNSSLEITYNILWTSMDYPSAYTAALGSNTFFSQNSVYSLRMQDNYVVIGPAFEVFLNSNSSVSITVIDESLIELNFLLLDVVHVSYWKQLHQMPTSITYLTLGS